MKFYRVKHVPTGLYFKPSSEVQIKIGGMTMYVKTNLSKKGKVYSTKPVDKWFTEGIYNHVQRQADLQAAGVTNVHNVAYRERHKIYASPITDWQVEEVQAE